MIARVAGHDAHSERRDRSFAQRFAGVVRTRTGPLPARDDHENSKKRYDVTRNAAPTPGSGNQHSGERRPRCSRNVELDTIQR